MCCKSLLEWEVWYWRKNCFIVDFRNIFSLLKFVFLFLILHKSSCDMWFSSVLCFHECILRAEEYCSVWCFVFLQMISLIILFPCWQVKKNVEFYSVTPLNCCICLPFSDEIFLTNFVAILCDILLVICCDDDVKRGCFGHSSAWLIFHRIADKLKLEGNSGGHLIQPPSSRAPVWVCRVNFAFKLPLRMEAP